MEKLNLQKTLKQETKGKQIQKNTSNQLKEEYNSEAKNKLKMI